MTEFVQIDAPRSHWIDRVDFRTGELFESIAYQPATSRLSLPAAPSLATVAGFTGQYQMERYLASKDGRTMKRVNDTRRIYDMDKGDHHLTGKPMVMSNRDYELINLLAQAVSYRNIILCTLSTAATLLQVSPKHVHRTLASLGGVVRVSTTREGIRKGHIKIEINPAYAFRYERDALESARANALNNWIRGVIEGSRP